MVKNILTTNITIQQNMSKRKDRHYFQYGFETDFYPMD